MVVSVSSPDRLSEKKWRKVSSFVRTAEEAGFTSLVLVASTPELFGGLVQDPFVLSHSYFADRKKLVTLNRSNAGVVFIDDAYIVSKWSFNHAPDKGDADGNCLTGSGRSGDVQLGEVRLEVSGVHAVCFCRNAFNLTI